MTDPLPERGPAAHKSTFFGSPPQAHLTIAVEPGIVACPGYAAPMAVRETLASLCGHRRLPWIAAAVAVVLTSPSLSFGLLADDWLQRARLQRHPALPRLSDPIRELFVFFDGSHAEHREGANMGGLPWWVPEGLKASFWRPLTARTHQLDYLLWPDAPWLMHLHSLLWFGLCVGIVAIAYRQLVGFDERPTPLAATAAGLAGLLFAVEDAHAAPASWIANRNASVAVVFGIGALLVHDRWRRGGRPPLTILSAALLGAGLLSSEAALAFGGYLFGYALFLDPARGVWRRLATLIPSALVFALWLTAYRAGGFGTWGARSYVDPLSSYFPQALAERVPLLLAAQWAQVPSDVWIGVPRTFQLGMTTFGLLVTVGLFAWLRPLLRQSREARFWATGMMLSLPPVCASFPMDRLLVFCGIGAFGLLGLASARCTLPGAGRWERRTTGVLLVVHLLAAPLLPLKTVLTKVAFDVFAAASDAAPKDEELRSQQLVMINGADMMTGFMLAIRLLQGEPVPRRVELLAHMLQPLQITRVGTASLVVRSEGGWIANPTEALMRDPTMPFARGDTFVRGTPALGVVTVVVEELTTDGRPLEVRFDFDVPLEDPSLRWVVWRKEGLVPFVPPGAGETVEVEPVWPMLRSP